MPSAGALLVAHALLSHVHAPQGDIGGVNWFAGVVTAARRDGTFDLNYDDGGAARRKGPGPRLTTRASVRGWLAIQAAMAAARPWYV